MSTERDVNRIVRSWMEEGVTALPDHVLDAVLDQIPATPQRRSAWSAWREFHMNKFVAMGLGIAAAVVALLIVGQFLGPNVGGPPAETPTPSVAPSVTSAPTPPPAGPLEARTRYAVSSDDLTLTFAVPTPGWSTDGFGNHRRPSRIA